MTLIRTDGLVIDGSDKNFQIILQIEKSRKKKKNHIINGSSKHSTFFLGALRVWCEGGKMILISPGLGSALIFSPALIVREGQSQWGFSPYK